MVWVGEEMRGMRQEMGEVVAVGGEKDSVRQREGRTRSESVGEGV